jgi:putative protease
VHALASLGIDSLKIEGRTKSAYYTARTTQVYHRAIEDAAAGRPFDMGMMDELEGLSNRGFTEGFYRRHPPGEFQNYEQGASRSDRQQVVGEVQEITDSWIDVDVKNRFEVGDRMEMVTPSGNLSFDMTNISSQDGKSLDAAAGSGRVVRIPVPAEATPGMIDEFAMLVRYLPE